MKVLITGGLGFIGSHTALALLEVGHQIVIVDNLSNSRIEVLDSIEKASGIAEIPFIEGDVTNAELINELFERENFDAIMHFAGYKSVNESLEKPIVYYKNNIMGTLELIEACVKHRIPRFIFSSSATVYGDHPAPLVEEIKELKANNPYGESKIISERILNDVARANPNLSIAILRYFNPIGAHVSGLLGESPLNSPNNLMPYILQVAKGNAKELKIFGNDYPTSDGTGIRDFIHVMDLAEGHVAALEKGENGAHIYNLGTGKGISVLELIQVFELVNKVEIPYVITGRRPGDIAISFAKVSKAERELGWQAKRNLSEMCRDAWNYTCHHETHY